MLQKEPGLKCTSVLSRWDNVSQIIEDYVNMRESIAAFRAAGRDASMTSELWGTRCTGNSRLLGYSG